MKRSKEFKHLQEQAYPARYEFTSTNTLWFFCSFQNLVGKKGSVIRIIGQEKKGVNMGEM